VFDDLNVDHLWMTFGKGKDLRWIPIHDTVRSLGPRSKALPLCHAFTCCDTVSEFVGKGQRQYSRPGMCLRMQHKYSIA
jgi:hypothetical protein